MRNVEGKVAALPDSGIGRVLTGMRDAELRAAPRQAA